MKPKKNEGRLLRPEEPNPKRRTEKRRLLIGSNKDRTRMDLVITSRRAIEFRALKRLLLM